MKIWQFLYFLNGHGEEWRRILKKLPLLLECPCCYITVDHETATQQDSCKQMCHKAGFLEFHDKYISTFQCLLESNLLQYAIC
jgi:hypothetical protein